MNQEHEKIIREISNRLSLRLPQEESVRILDDILDTVLPEKNADIGKQLSEIQKKYPAVTDFGHKFMSLCFELATGVGKTRLMGAFIAYLYKAYQIKHFFVVAPNLTIYQKLKDDFSETNSPKYVFKGIDVFCQNPPAIVTGDNYQHGGGVMQDELFDSIVINIFNIDKVSIKDGQLRKIWEKLGDSYFNYLAGCNDLVILMDEAHHYRSDTGKEANKVLDELHPVLGLELTATPFSLSSFKSARKGESVKAKEKITIEKDLFKNIVYQYDLPAAIRDEFVKRPAIVTRENFESLNLEKDSESLEKLKLKDGILVHEQTRLSLANYAFNNGVKKIKPFMLVVAGDTKYANELYEYLTSPDFQNGYYADKTIIIHSALEAKDKSLMSQELRDIELPENKIEIVIHVNMLSEGWDVSNLYTIVPLRKANSLQLIFQSLGRGLRLPYGAITGNDDVDRLNVVSHDNYKAVIHEANMINLKMEERKIAESDEHGKKTVSFVPLADQMKKTGDLPETQITDSDRVAAVILKEADKAAENGKFSSIQKTADQVKISLKNVSDHDIQEAVKKIQSLTIEIPWIISLTAPQVLLQYADFDLDCTTLPCVPIPHTLKTATLFSKKSPTYKDVGNVSDDIDAAVEALIKALEKYEDWDYDSNAELVRKLLSQYIHYLRDEKKLSSNDDICSILAQTDLISANLYKQMKNNAEYSGGEEEFHLQDSYLPLRIFEAQIDCYETPRNYRYEIADGQKSKIKNMVFEGFQKCLYPLQKFDSDQEREFARILDDAKEVQKWFKPSMSNFYIPWRGHRYKPDFIVEAINAKYICEVKADKKLENPEVLEKRKTALQWCQIANQCNSQKKWFYLLLPHSKVNADLDFSGVRTQYLQA